MRVQKKANEREGDGMKEMIERLKNTWTAFGGLAKEEQEFMREHMAAEGYVCIIEKNGRFVPYYGEFFSGCIYRLRPDFEMPEPVKRWFFNTNTNEITKSINALCEEEEEINDGWIEIAEDEKRYLETKPEPVEGFDWVLKMPDESKKEKYMTVGGTLLIGCGFISRDILNGIRWTRVPVKSRFVDGTALINGVEVPCKVKEN